ncbi:MAG: hypothetical protein ACLQIB_02650 [Isosphaeraceae bacterium]
MKLETSISLSPPCLVRIREEPEGQFTAELLGAPDIQATAATRAEAAERVRALLQNHVNLGSIVAIETPPQRPLMELAGMYKDDPSFDDFLEEIRKFRQEEDRRAGYVPDMDECFNTSSTPTT